MARRIFKSQKCWFLPVRCGEAWFSRSVDRRRGFKARPTNNELRVGDTIDFWRVEKFEPNHLLQLFAEMKIPGRAWLEFEVSGDAYTSTIRQTAIFDPVGLFGQLYWYALWPLHQLVFRGMLRRIREAAASAWSCGRSPGRARIYQRGGNAWFA